MKFMKLGSKPDSFQTDVNDIRSVANELPTDFIIIVGDVKFYLHKFPLLSKSARLQKSATNANGDNSDEVDLSDIPGGPSAFEICAKFCYGMIVTLNAFNVVAARCASEYLGMHENIEKGNLIYKIDVFLSSSIFRCWKDSVTALQTTKSLLPLCDELKLTSNCVDAVATKACVDISKVDWSYSYNRKKLPEENGNDQNVNGIRNRSVPMDWWVEDLCDLDIELYKRVIMAIKYKAILSSDVIGESLKAYAYKRLQGLSKGMVQCGEAVKYKPTVDAILWLLPAERGSVSCNFLLKLLKAAIYVDLGDMAKEQLIRRIGQQLEEAKVNDLLIRTSEAESMMYDIDMVKKIVEEFLMQDRNAEVVSSEETEEIREIRRPGILSDASKLMVAKLIDGYLAEIAKDPNLPVSNFVELAEMVSGISRPAHDALYRAIDMFLKEHPGISKSERKRICKLMDCKKLSVDACMHAVQNERLPLRVVVQVLFFEQVRIAATSGSSTPDLPKSLRDLNNGSSRSAATNPEEDWDALATAEELKALKTEIASLRLSNGERERNSGYVKNGIDKSASKKVKGLIKSKMIFAKLWLNKGEKNELSGSDSSDSVGSANPEEAKSTPSRNRRHSVS
ncbi:BTB/POZ domain-containing protein NPY2 [Mercurialis annua]|uniref:BTB/POZ domain-containing protein NPY2 n=1 Tax=Mercurialis annua TaxID=3986 RepID=UPI00215F6342|nr:BTB/POZ domain-containing protein NPY2 [Mercurialis annua]XP_050212249.1 BTB/POZ domain-containing protein NPY2 [Mercurialis annua]XP_050212250.1 BTB/POZ domain-containing protein NPY2 [Mercurialis annua]